MIAVDSSAVVALFLAEPGYEAIAAILDEEDAAISVVSRLEIVAVLCGRHRRADPARVADFIDGLHLDTQPVSVEQLTFALDALLTYGRGRHPARLNLGDCFSYGLARSLGAPLLFKGDDFARTDILPAWRPPSQNSDR